MNAPARVMGFVTPFGKASPNFRAQTLDLTTLATPPTLTADAMAMNEVFTIGHRGKYETENFNTFAAFVAALSADLTPTAAVVGLAASGQYDSGASTFTATRIAVLIND